MRVHLIKKQTIEEYVMRHARSRSSFNSWLYTIRFADWNKPGEIQQTFVSADLLGNGSNRVVFNVGGNNYRMICKYVFGEKQVHLFVCWVGSHSEYDKLCDAKEQYITNLY